MWKLGELIGNKEGRLDIAVACAGVLKQDIDCLEYPADVFQQVMNVNVNGVLYTAQAAGRQMRRFGNGGSIILIGSMSGSITNQVSNRTFFKCCRGETDHMDNNRDTSGSRTTPLSLPCSRWRAAWPAS